MNNVYDNTVIVDECGRLNGTSIGGYLSEGMVDGVSCFHAPTIPDRIVFPKNILPTTGPYTLSSWVYMDAYGVDHCIVYAYTLNNSLL